MGVEDGGFLSSTSSEVPIEHLEYNYIRKCSNVKEIEKILKILRSGEEGYYPDLISFTENRLLELNPKSKSLRKEIPIKNLRDLDKSEKNEITEDLQEWMSDISDKDNKLLKSKTMEGNASLNDSSKSLPPIRSSASPKVPVENQEPVQTKGVNKKKTGPVAPRTYDQWDRFDPDKELQKQEEEEKKRQSERNENAQRNSLTSKIPEVVNTGKNAEEITLRANREKDKGNEAFRSGDFEEAIVYYSRSICFAPTAASYNNRALVEIKLDRFQEAIEDCNKVLSIEPDNMKAFLRRAIAHKGLSMLDEARDDLHRVLSIEPNNKRAKELTKEWRLQERNTAKPDEVNPTRTDNSETRVTPEKTGEVQNPKLSGDRSDTQEKTHKKGRRLKIIDVERDEETESAEISQSAKPEGVASTENAGTNNRGAENQVILSQPSTHTATVVESEVKTEEVNTTQTERSANPVGVAERGDSKLAGAGDEARAGNSDSGARARSIPHPELPGFVVKAKDEATKLYTLGRYAEAMEKYSETIDVLSKDKALYREPLSTLLGNRAACLNRIGDCTGSIADCCAALELVPRALKPLLRRATAYEALEKYPLAYRDYQTALSIQPDNQHALQGNTRTTKQLQILYGAQWKERAMRSGPTQPSSQPLIINEQKAASIAPSVTSKGSNPVAAGGSSLVEETKELTATQKYQQCKERGNAMVKQGKFDEAVKCYTECIGTSPGEVASYTNRALCYLRLDKFELAEADSSAALKLQPDNVKALFRRAQAKKALKNYDTAARDLFDLIKIDPNNTAAKKELELVLSLCREERRATQEKSSSHEVKETKSKGRVNNTEKKKKKSKSPEPQETKTPTRKRILIEEVQHDDEDMMDFKSSPKEPEQSKTAQAGGTANVTKPSKPSQVDKPRTSTDSGTQLPKLTKPYDFLQAWNSVKKNDAAGYARVLRRLNPKSLPQVIGNKLDAAMLTSIVSALSKELISQGGGSLAFEILSQLHEVQRFDMVLLFLSAKEKEELRQLFMSVEQMRSEHGFTDDPGLLTLRQKFKV